MGSDTNGSEPNRKESKMNSLDMTKSKTEKLEALEDLAINTLTEALKDERGVDDKTKIAMKTLNMVAKNRQTMTAREGIRFSMAQSIAKDGQLAKYVSTTQPEVRNALTGTTVEE